MLSLLSLHVAFMIMGAAMMMKSNTMPASYKTKRSQNIVESSRNCNIKILESYLAGITPYHDAHSNRFALNSGDQNLEFFRKIGLDGLMLPIFLK